METAKAVLERLEALNNRSMSGMGVLSEIHELIDLAGKGAQEIYQAEIDAENQNELLSYYERGQTAWANLRKWRKKNMKSAITLVIDRHSFRELAKLTNNPQLRKVYAKMMCRYYRLEQKNAL